MNKSRGFTLIELLIVIAILALIISLLFPVLRSAWDTSLMVRCQNNMRQICLAMIEYASEHDDKLPGGSWDPPSIEWVGNPDALGGRGANLWRTPQQGALFPYVRNEKVYVCPKDHSFTSEEIKARRGPPHWDRGAGLGNGRFSYTMAAILQSASLSLVTRSRCEYTDIDDKNHAMIAPMLIEEGEWFVAAASPDGSWSDGDTFSDRHLDGCNMGYIDGHVELRKMTLLNSWDLKFITPKGTITYSDQDSQGQPWRMTFSLDEWYEQQ